MKPITVSFLDLTITRNPSRLNIGIHHKPTTTDTTINFLSNQPPEHKLAAYRFIRRMIILPPQKKQCQDEWQNILQTAHRNNFSRNIITKLKHRIQAIAQHPPPLQDMTPNGQPSHTRCNPKVFR